MRSCLTRLDTFRSLAPQVLTGGRDQATSRPAQSCTRTTGTTRIRLLMPALKRFPTNDGIINIEFLPWRARLVVSLLALAALGGLGILWRATRVGRGNFGPARVAAVALPTGLVTFGLTRLATSPEYSTSYLAVLLWYGLGFALAARLSGPRGAMATAGVAGLGLLATDPTDAAFWVLLWALYGLSAGIVLLAEGVPMIPTSRYAFAAGLAAPMLVGSFDVAVLEHVLGLLPADPRAELLTHCPPVALHCHASGAVVVLALGSALGLGVAARIVRTVRYGTGGQASTQS